MREYKKMCRWKALNDIWLCCVWKNLCKDNKTNQLVKDSEKHFNQKELLMWNGDIQTLAFARERKQIILYYKIGGWGEESCV